MTFWIMHKSVHFADARTVSALKKTNERKCADGSVHATDKKEKNKVFQAYTTWKAGWTLTLSSGLSATKLS